jgi:gliding motility-associated-like protein
LRLKILVAFFLISSSAFGQYCTLPSTITSATLSYIQTETPIDNLRFFYKVTVECGGSILFGFDALHVFGSAGFDPDGTIYSWVQDSIKNITGVLDPCILLDNPPCFTVYYYHADIHSPNIEQPFTVSTTYCCRPINAANIDFQPNFIGYQNPPPSPQFCPKSPGGTVGNAMGSFFRMPAMPTGPFNSSPQFSNRDTILSVCKDRSLFYQVLAIDPDGDSVVYHFNTPRSYTLQADSKGNLFTNYHVFPELQFNSGYSEQAPAGPNLSLDPVTGILQGKIDVAGTYDLTISALDYRSGVLLDSTTEDLYLKVYDCGALTKPVASIPDSINSCTDFTILFPNYSQPIYQNVNWNNTTFSWNFGDGDSSQAVYPTHTYADTGTYKARLIIFPGQYCADTTFSSVIVYPFVHAAFDYSDSCADRYINFTNISNSTSGAISSSSWEILEDTTLLFSSNGFNSSYDFAKAPQTYKIKLAVRNDKGCEAEDSAELNIYRSPNPLLTHDTILSRGASLHMMVDDGNSNFDGQYLWVPSLGLSDPLIAEPVLESTTDTIYYVMIKNKFGCELTDSIRVKYYTGPDIYVPNAFSPNQDGKNDIFKPIPVGISTMSYFRVFDRYGQLVFETRTPNQGWDGNIHGLPSPEGAYVWEVAGTDLNGKLVMKKGTVVLIR